MRHFAVGYTRAEWRAVRVARARTLGRHDRYRPAAVIVSRLPTFDVLNASVPTPSATARLMYPKPRRGHR